MTARRTTVETRPKKWLVTSASSWRPVFPDRGMQISSVFSLQHGAEAPSTIAARKDRATQRLALVGLLLTLVGWGWSESGESTSRLIEQLGHADFAVRRAASQSLKSIGEEAAPALLPLLRSPDPELRHHARDILKTIAVGQHELHLVGLYEGVRGAAGKNRMGRPIGRAEVVVDRPGKLITLVLSAYEPVLWEVQTSPDTRLAKIVLSGYHEQSVEGVDESVARQELFHTRHRKGHYVYKPDDPKFPALVKWLQAETSLHLASFQGAYAADPTEAICVDAVQLDLFKAMRGSAP